MSALLPVTAAFGVAATTAPLLPGVPPVVTWGALAAGYVSLVAHGSACVGARLLGTAVCRLDGRCDAVALTFDDGPDPATTPRLLDLLREHRARATFCCIGERVRAAPAIVRRIRDEGHVLGNHSDQHSSFSPFYFAGRLQRELVACQQAIEVAAGVAPRWFRPPMGVRSHATHAVCDRLGLQVLGWSVRSFDLPAADPTRVAARVLSRLTGGDIVLLHDGGRDPVRLTRLVATILAAMASRGLAAAAIDAAAGTA